jgi:serine protease Do
MVLSALNDKTRTRLGLEKDDTGVIVTNVDPNGIAAAKGVRPGDVIRRVSGQQVSTPEDVIRMVDKALENAKTDERKALLVLVSRNGNDRYVALPLRDA